MASLTIPSSAKIIGTLTAEQGKIPVVTFGESSADRINVRVYASGWGRLVDWSDDITPPLSVDLNKVQGIKPGKYEVEFRPFRNGKYVGADRQFFSLTVTEPKPAESGGNTPGHVKRLVIGIVDATKALRADTPCFSEHWDGARPWVDVCRSTGITVIREWLSFDASFTRWDKWDRIKPFIAAGMRLVLSVNWKGAVPTAAQIKTLVAKILADIPAWAIGKVVIEAGNEPDHKDDKGKKVYWPGTLAQYVSQFLNPLYEVCNAAGYRVILGGLNGNFANDFKVIVAAGGKFDIVGIHPYSLDVASFKAKYAALFAQTNKPVWETESRAFLGQQYKAGTKTAEQWIAEDKAQLEARRSMPQIELYSLFSPDVRDSATGPGGLFSITVKNGKPVRADATVFFDDWFAKVAA